MTTFDFEKLDVYRVSLEFIMEIEKIIQLLPKGRSHLADQLFRASTSVSLNIAEGAGEFALGEKIRFYRIARRSATECASILEIGNQLNLVDDQNYKIARDLLLRIVAMLTKMVRD